MNQSTHSMVPRLSSLLAIQETAEFRDDIPRFRRHKYIKLAENAKTQGKRRGKEGKMQRVHYSETHVTLEIYLTRS